MLSCALISGHSACLWLGCDWYILVGWPSALPFCFVDSIARLLAKGWWWKCYTKTLLSQPDTHHISQHTNFPKLGIFCTFSVHEMFLVMMAGSFLVHFCLGVFTHCDQYSNAPESHLYSSRSVMHEHPSLQCRKQVFSLGQTCNHSSSRATNPVRCWMVNTPSNVEAKCSNMVANQQMNGLESTGDDCQGWPRSSLVVGNHDEGKGHGKTFQAGGGIPHRS